MELLNLQSSLQSEIQAKQAINEELSKTRSELIASQKSVLLTSQLTIKINFYYHKKTVIANITLF